ncbi:proteasome subunit alpha type-3 [Teleopsis dalmanni]|uniref:proteasome subunit alpha type-3 n=1 Tax=Teleopsis dalmanni TaxID=139649 RepID=UPI0018CC8A3D|nr:proteasome subunit alpha type-3 [Teleopsis dalmanni]
MSSIGTGYDLSASQFSPDGRVFQIDYASKALERSGTVIGLRGKDCVVLAAEKLITSKLYEDNSGGRVYTIDQNIGCVFAGLLADGRQLVEIARSEAKRYRNNLNRTIPLKELVERVAAYMHAYTLYSAVRPFGVSVIFAAYDDLHGPQLYKIEPAGTSFGYLACATGKAKQQAKTEMEKYTFKDMSTEDLIIHAGKIIYQVHDELKDKDFVFELGVVGKETNSLHTLNPPKWVLLAEEAGKAAKSEDDSDNEI